MGVEAVMLVVLLAVAVLLWAQQFRSGNAGWVDVFWSWGTGLTGMLYLLVGDGSALPRAVAGVLLMTWALRLGSHIFQRVRNDPEEDGRYAAMRQALGSRTQPVFFLFYLGQGLLAWVFSLPFSVIGDQQNAEPLLVITGLLIGMGAIFGESVADAQLKRFKARSDSRGKTCREGLWRYSRHPNYFFEWLHWCSYPLVATGAALVGFLWLLPIAMLAFLWFVTGIPYTEKQALKSRGDDYRKYQRTTSAFFPWRPRS